MRVAAASRRPRTIVAAALLALGLAAAPAAAVAAPAAPAAAPAAPAAAVPAASAAAAPAAVASSTLPLRRCSSAARDRSRCGRLSVPLDRGGAVRGSVSLKVRVLPASDGRAQGTVFALAGGPGQAAAPLLQRIAQMLRPLLRTRQLVAFDQRGTGGSGRLTCPGLAQAGDDDAFDRAVGGCARRLGVRRTAYTSAESVDDIEAVRSALGVDRIVLYGVSYGTKVALDYAARYPQHVSRLLLDSVLLPSGSDPFMRTTIASVPRVLRQLCSGRACRFTRDPVEDLRRLVARIAARGPLSGVTYDGRGRQRVVTITREDLLNLLLAGDLVPVLRAMLPGAVRAALDGDTVPLASLLSGGGAPGLDSSQDSDALFIATSCEDGGVPWPVGTPIDGRAAATEAALDAIPEADLAPFDRATLRGSDVGYCRTWPEAPIAQPIAPLPDVPTLILSGDDDLRTPRSDALALADAMPSAQLVTVPETGHSVLGADSSGCARRAVKRFFAGQRPGACRSRPPRAVAPVSPPPAHLSSLPGFRGLSPRTGRTLTAVNLTFEQLLIQMISELFGSIAESGPAGRIDVSFGGLRGGWVRVTPRALTAHGYSYVTGVAISMRVSLADADRDPPVVVRVGGAAAAHGTLRFTPTTISGTLGGHRIVLRRVRTPRSREGRAAVATAVDDRLAAAERSDVSSAALRDALDQARRAAAALGSAPCRRLTSSARC